MTVNVKTLRNAIGSAMLVDVGESLPETNKAVTRLLVGEIALTTLLRRDDLDMQAEADTNGSSNPQIILAILNAIVAGEQMVGRSLQMDLERYLALAQRISTHMA